MTHTSGHTRDSNEHYMAKRRQTQHLPRREVLDEDKQDRMARFICHVM